MTGHRTLKEIVRYTKAADQARMARAARARTASQREQSVADGVRPEPTEVSRAEESDWQPPTG